MEVLGLAIVVVLILVAVIFFVQLGFNKPADYRTSFLASHTAYSMLSTFLRTSANECFYLSMTELIQDCGQGKRIVCNDGKDSCSYVNATSKEIFSKTLNSWNREYQFVVYADLRYPLINISEKCTSKKELESGNYVIPASSSPIYVRLDICI